MKLIASLFFALFSTLAVGSVGCAVDAEEGIFDEGEPGQAVQASSTSGSTKACCNQTASGGLTGCTKPYSPPSGGATCVGGMVKALCDERYNNCTSGGW